MERRAFLASGVLWGGALLAFTLAGCIPTPENNVSLPPSPQPTADPTPSAAGSRVLVAYFSRPGENYYYGDRIDLDVGNTQVIAEMIAAAASVDVYRIEAADPYPEGYDETVARNVREENENARPAIANPLPDTTGYDSVLLGCPVWNVQTPMIMRTFVENIELAGKIIHPFVTYAVSGMGRVRDDYARLCPGSTIGEGLAIQGETATQAQPDVASWLRRIGL